tara:strand:+ start:447 stop:1406 length:960 start_codon:yes stop_codon:yes gene_type:complete
MKKVVLVTGSAGFIGFHLSSYLLKEGYHVYGIDNFSNYYDVKLKKKRTKILKKNKNYHFFKIDLTNKDKLIKFFQKKKIKTIIHLAAQPGVRLSFINREIYFRDNMIAFFNLMEICIKNKIKHFLYASSSSVYGESQTFPNKESNNTNEQVSFYAATKKCNEIIASSYSKMCDTKFTGLRLFTVYGPLGRPDMALYKFTKNIIKKKKIDIYNKGNHYRDFTYIDDVVNLIFEIIKKKTTELNNHEIFNVCYGKSIKLTKYINLIEKYIGMKSIKKFIKKQNGDVFKTFGSNKKILKFTDYKINFKVEKGIKKFISEFEI